MEKAPNINFNYFSLVAVLLRVGMLHYGTVQDRKYGLKYTDIDYTVFSDAAKLVSKGKSPYERPTYRYSPLLALMLTPNSRQGPLFGKILFIIFDILTGLMIRFINRNRPIKQRIISVFIWDLNPFVINISTRGNCDSIISFLIILTIACISMGFEVFGAVIYGIAVHFRIYPAFFALSIIVLMKRNSLRFGFISFLVFIVITFIFFSIYRAPFLEETYLYHLHRVDFRHNFAAPWYPNYVFDSPNMIWGICRILIVVALSIKAKYLEYTWAAITMVFIAYNPVCTVQYFDWLFCLLAIIPDVFLDKNVIISLVSWALSHIVWLLVAYKLEFQGENRFSVLWVCSIIIFAAANYLIFSLIGFPRTQTIMQMHPGLKPMEQPQLRVNLAKEKREKRKFKKKIE
jgi:phosphatidylinositol glycan class M